MRINDTHTHHQNVNAHEPHQCTTSCDISSNIRDSKSNSNNNKNNGKRSSSSGTANNNDKTMITSV